MRVLVTGATGFVGRHLCAALLAAGHQVKAVTRRDHAFNLAAGIQVVNMGNLGPNKDWRSSLTDIDTVIHLAARTHVLRDSALDPEAEYHRINVGATTALGVQAAAGGVHRFIFLSSVKAGAEVSLRDIPLQTKMPPNPQDAYGRTKLAAEKALGELSAESDMDVVVLRPPLIYGPGVKGNFLELFNAVNRGVPLPLRWVDNRRDLIYVENLVAALMRVMEVPATICGTHYVCDGDAVSTPELIRRTADALNRPARLLPMPERALRLAGWMTGRSEVIKRLTESLCIDGHAFRRRAAWSPPFSMKEGLARTAAWYKSQR